jgi:hypothetical protein
VSGVCATTRDLPKPGLALPGFSPPWRPNHAPFERHGGQTRQGRSYLDINGQFERHGGQTLASLSAMAAKLV